MCRGWCENEINVNSWSSELSSDWYEFHRFPDYLKVENVCIQKLSLCSDMFHLVLVFHVAKLFSESIWVWSLQKYNTGQILFHFNILCSAWSQQELGRPELLNLFLTGTNCHHSCSKTKKRCNPCTQTRIKEDTGGDKERLGYGSKTKIKGNGRKASLKFWLLLLFCVHFHFTTSLVPCDLLSSLSHASTTLNTDCWASQDGRNEKSASVSLQCLPK